MPRPSRAKPPISAWIIRERKRLGLKPPDLAERLSGMGLPVETGTVRTWEAGRNPHPDNVEGLERIFGSTAPGATEPSSDQSALIAALDRQTAAIRDLLTALGVQDARHEADHGSMLAALGALTDNLKRAGTPVDPSPAVRGTPQ